MERRKFIQATLVSAPMLATTASAGTRLYGTPGSVATTVSPTQLDSGKLFLSLSRTGLPPQFWDKIQSVSTVILGVLNSADEGKAFAQSPASYLAKHGLDHSDAVLEDETVRLIAAISQPTVQAAIANKDHALFMQYLKSTGVLNFDSSLLQKQIEGALSKNVDELRETLRNGLNQLPSEERESLLAMLASPGAATDDDLAITYQLMKSELGATPAMAIAVVSIAVVLATVAAAVVLWVYAAGWVWGVPNEALRAAGLGKLAEADPNLTKSHGRAMKIAALTGETAILEESARAVLLAECIAVVQALRNTQILNISSESAERLAEAMTLYAYKTAGI